MSKSISSNKPNWVNRTIWTGDNLDIMRGMNSGSVDLIYLDPPFNSNQTYSAPIGSEAAGAAFKDTWSLSDVDEAWHGEIAEAEPALYTVIDAAGIAHGKGMKSYLIMMAPRLLEMRRLLKDKGSLYLHCDDTAGHYLKVICDAIFGPKKFQSDIKWKRVFAHNDSKSFGRVTDSILFYGHPIHKDAVRVPLDPKYIKSNYRHNDPQRGLYREAPLTAKGLSGRGYYYDFHGHPGPWRYPETRMLELEADGRIHLPKKENGVPCLRRFLSENKGQVPSSLWTDISPVQGSSRERTGYPTQKPLALLNRIIKASSNPGDVVLDPFCGCATACIAAEQNGREWVGIDLSGKAAELIRVRADKELGGAPGGQTLFKLTHRTDTPKRTDQGKLPHYRTHKQILFGHQEGHCNGCRFVFPFHTFHVDHVIPRSKGGTDHIDNLQLLCASCNSLKGSHPHEWLIAELKKQGIRY